MRVLTVKQKKYLDKVLAEDKTVDDVNSLSWEQWETLEKMNDTEILYQEANRYITDKRWDEGVKEDEM